MRHSPEIRYPLISMWTGTGGDAALVREASPWHLARAAWPDMYTLLVVFEAHGSARCCRIEQLSCRRVAG